MANDYNLLLDTSFYKERIDSLRTIIEENPGYLSKMPKAEQDLYFYLIVRKITQKEIAPLLGITQGAVSSRLSRLKKRLEFLQELEKFNLENFEANLFLFDAFEVELLRGMLETTCQSETARRLNNIYGIGEQSKTKMTQVKVRHRFEKLLFKMKEAKHPYYELFLLVKNNLYMLHEVKLPHFGG